MKKLCLVVVAFLALLVAGAAFAEDVKFVGTIKSFTVAADGASAEAVVKDEETKKDVTVFIEDDLTLDKLKDKRIVVGDEVRVKYEAKNGKNMSKYFRKTAGC